MKTKLKYILCLLRGAFSSSKEDKNIFNVENISDLRVEQTRDAELLLGHPEGQGVVAEDVAGLEALHAAAQQPGPEVINQGAEGDPVPPALVHIQDVHIFIESRHAPAPDLREKIFVIVSSSNKYSYIKVCVGVSACE